MAAIFPELFNVHTPSADINQFLDQLAHNPHNIFRIHPHVIAYKSKNMKNNAVQLAVEADRRDYEACDIMQQAKHSMVSSGSLLWLSGNITAEAAATDLDQVIDMWMEMIERRRDQQSTDTEIKEEIKAEKTAAEVFRDNLTKSLEKRGTSKQ
ncbi:hypothetical protein BGX38DRAFT_1260608 [Terfezia claveryi]|nr:hypothetical protein BGX38DRAFT_1260608 [Terfezia claveryi]